MAITKRIIKGSPLTAAEMDANLDVLQIISSSFTSVSASVSNLSTLQGTLSGQFTGSALISGSNASLIISGALKINNANLPNDTSTNKVLVHNPTTNTIGWNTIAGVGTSGTSGVNGTAGSAGSGGTSGLDGTNFGSAGSTGTAGTSGTNGSTGTAGTSGTNGSTGTAGTSGISGTNGTAGSTGSAGTSGTTGSSGTSTDSNLTNRLMQTTASLNIFTGSIRGEVSGLEAYTASLKQTPLISSSAQITALGFISSSAGSSGPFAQTGSFWAAHNNIQITGSLRTILEEGYLWVGGPGNVNKTILTSSLGGGGGTITVIRSGTTFPSVDTLQLSTNFSVSNLGGGDLLLDIVGGGGGVSGTNGTSGTSGLPGSSGSTGSSGTSGISGDTGVNGTNGTAGSGGASGTNGTSGTTGSTGVSGTSGTDGAGGTNGTGGLSGTSGTSTQLGIRDGGGISSVFNVNDISFSGSVQLTPSGSNGVIVTITGGSGGFTSSSYNGWITGSQQILEAGYVQSSSGIFKDFIVTQSMVRNWSVVNDTNSNYVLTPSNDPTLERGPDVDIWVYQGDTLVFNVNASGHPFWIKVSPTIGTGNTVSGVTNNGTQNGIVVWNTTGSLAGTYYYQCQNHSAMGGAIYIKERQRRTQFRDGRIVHSGSMWVDGGIIVTGSIWFSGSLYQNGVPFVGGGGGGPFAQTASYFSANGDIFVTGSLRVSGSITASAITVTSPGTPEIYSATNINLNAGNAVVITSSSLRLTQFTNAQTGGLTPANGDMYYNTTINKFVGRIGGNWMEFPSGSSVGGSGISGTSGTSGLLELTGNLADGIITYNGSANSATVESSLKFNGNIMEVSSSVHIQTLLRITATNPLPPVPVAGTFAVSASGAVLKPYFFDGSVWNELY